MLKTNDNQHSAIQTCMDRLAEDVLERGGPNLLRLVYEVTPLDGEPFRVGALFGRPSNYMKVICYVPEEGAVTRVASFDNYHKDGIALRKGDRRRPMRWVRVWDREEDPSEVTVPGTPFSFIDHDSCWRQNAFNPRNWREGGLVEGHHYSYESAVLMSASLETFSGEGLKEWSPPEALDLATALLTLRALWCGETKLNVDMTVCKRQFENGRLRDPQYPISDDLNEDPNWCRYDALFQFDLETGMVTHAQSYHGREARKLSEIEALPEPEWLDRKHLVGSVFEGAEVSIAHLFLTFPEWGQHA